MNVTTFEVNVTTKDRHYLVVNVNCSDHTVVKVNTFYFNFFNAHIDVVNITE